MSEQATHSDTHSTDAGSQQSGSVAVEIEKERTKRHLIEAISSIVAVLLYMGFTLLRERDPGVVVVDPDETSLPEDDWAE